MPAGAIRAAQPGSTAGRGWQWIAGQDGRSRRGAVPAAAAAAAAASHEDDTALLSIQCARGRGGEAACSSSSRRAGPSAARTDWTWARADTDRYGAPTPRTVRLVSACNLSIVVCSRIKIVRERIHVGCRQRLAAQEALLQQLRDNEQQIADGLPPTKAPHNAASASISAPPPV
jgi:hypothetical protein